MKRKQKSADIAECGPAPIRTGEIIPVAGIWEIRCSRDGCRAVSEVNLRQGELAPPCIRCLNRSSLHFLREATPGDIGDNRFRFRRGLALVELPAEAAPRPAEEKAVAPAAPPAEETKSAARIVEGVHVSWAAEDPPAFAECVGPEQARELLRSRGGVVMIPTVEPQKEKAPSIPDEPSLMEKLVGRKSGKRKIAK